MDTHVGLADVANSQAMCKQNAVQFLALNGCCVTCNAKSDEQDEKDEVSKTATGLSQNQDLKFEEKNKQTCVKW